MRERLRWLLAAYDWLARIHFALFGLGGLAVLGGVGSYVLSAFVPALAFGAMGALALILGSVGWVSSRQVDRDVAFWRDRALSGMALAEIAVDALEKAKPSSRATRQSRGRSRRDQ